MKTTKTQKVSRVGAFFKRNLGLFLLILSLLAVGTTITLAVLLSDGNPIEPPDDGGQVIAPNITYALPVANYTLGEESSLESLVWLSSLKRWGTHNGLDFIAAEGEQVMAIADGTVKSVGTNALEGTVVEIEHADGYVSIYKSLSEDVKVSAGMTVTKGQLIGYVSDSAIFESHVGAHLHLEVKKDGSFIDPASLFDELGDK